MSDRIVRLSEKDMPEALDFLNMVYSMAGRPHDFGKVLPAMWLDGEESMRRHLAIRVNGRIAALIGVYPLPAVIAGEKILFATMGNVATHPYLTGRGLMTELLRAGERELDSMGADAARLSGLRQRYGMYGFEPCGVNYEYTLTAHNILRHFGGRFSSGIRFEETGQTDTGLLEYARGLHSGNAFRVIREDAAHFYAAATAWGNRMLTAYRGNIPVGYLSVTKNGMAADEFAAVDDNTVFEMLCAYVRSSGVDAVRITLAPWQAGLCRMLGEIAEGWSTVIPSSFRVRSFEKLVGALMKLKAEYSPMPDGRAVIGIKDHGNIEMMVGNGLPSCRPTDEVAECMLDRREASRLLFGPLPPSAVIELPRSLSILQAWLPLPLSWDTLDRV